MICVGHHYAQTNINNVNKTNKSKKSTWDARIIRLSTYWNNILKTVNGCIAGRHMFALLTIKVYIKHKRQTPPFK